MKFFLIIKWYPHTFEQIGGDIRYSFKKKILWMNISWIPLYVANENFCDIILTLDETPGCWLSVTCYGTKSIFFSFEILSRYTPGKGWLQVAMESTSSYFVTFWGKR